MAGYYATVPVTTTPECAAQLRQVLSTLHYGREDVTMGVLSKCPAGKHDLDIDNGDHTITAVVYHVKHDVRHVKFGPIVSQAHPD